MKEEQGEIDFQMHIIWLKITVILEGLKNMNLQALYFRQEELLRKKKGFTQFQDWGTRQPTSLIFLKSWQFDGECPYDIVD